MAAPKSLIAFLLSLSLCSAIADEELDERLWKKLPEAPVSEADRFDVAIAVKEGGTIEIDGRPYRGRDARNSIKRDRLHLIRSVTISVQDTAPSSAFIESIDTLGSWEVAKVTLKGFYHDAPKKAQAPSKKPALFDAALTEPLRLTIEIAGDGTLQVGETLITEGELTKLAAYASHMLKEPGVRLRISHDAAVSSIRKACLALSAGGIGTFIFTAIRSAPPKNGENKVAHANPLPAEELKSERNKKPESEGRSQ